MPPRSSNRSSDAGFASDPRAEPGRIPPNGPSTVCGEDDTLPEILNLNQAASFLQLSTDAVARLIRRGELRAARLGRSYRLLRCELLADLQAISEHQRRQREGDDQS